MNKNNVLVPFILSFLRPFESLANSFEQSSIQFFPSDPIINCLYSSIFLGVASSTTSILRRGLMDGLEARFISCWTRCCNLVGRLMVVKTASVLSREKVIGQRLGVNSGDVERKGDVF